MTAEQLAQGLAVVIVALVVVRIAALFFEGDDNDQN